MAGTWRPGEAGNARRWWRATRWVALAALLTLPCWGVPVFCLTFPKYQEWSTRVPFDPAAWKATQDSEARYHMSWGLVHGDVLNGKTAPEAEQLLGEPMTKDVFQSASAMPMFSNPHVQRGVETWYYDLGGELYDPGLGPSGAVLAVDFRGGKVFDVRKVVH
jgi:hypothetical protein